MFGMFIWCAHLEAMVGLGMLIFYGSLSPEVRREMGPGPAILALAMPPIAFSLPKLFLLHIVYFLIVPVFATRRSLIVPIYLFALMLLPDFRTPLVAGPVYFFYGTIYDSLGFGALLTMLTRFPAYSRIRPASDIPVLLIMLVLMFGRSNFGSLTNLLRVYVEMLLTYGLPYYIASRGVRSIDDVKRVMLYMACAAVMISVIMCYEALRTWPMYRILYTHYGVDFKGMVKLRSGWLRATGTTIETTSMAFILVPCFLAARCSRRAFASSWQHIGVLCLLGLGLALPQSRGALVGLLFAMTAMNIYLRRWAAVGGVAFLAIGIALATLVVPAESRLGSMLGKSAETSGTADYRKDLFWRGLEEIRKRPVLGASETEVMANLEDLRQGEGIIDFVNTYLYVALVTGVVGLIPFVAGLAGQPLALWKIRRGLPPRGADIDVMAFIFAGILAPMEMLAFTSLGGRPSTFIMMLIGFAAALVSQRRYAVKAGMSSEAGDRRADARSTQPNPSGVAMPEAGEWREPVPKGMGRPL